MGDISTLVVCSASFPLENSCALIPVFQVRLFITHGALPISAHQWAYDPNWGLWVILRDQYAWWGCGLHQLCEWGKPGENLPENGANSRKSKRNRRSQWHNLNSWMWPCLKPSPPLYFPFICTNKFLLLIIPIWLDFCWSQWQSPGNYGA